MAELIAIRDKAGAVVLYDMFIDGVWHGSRRTLAQCGAYLKRSVSQVQQPHD